MLLFFWYVEPYRWIHHPFPSPWKWILYSLYKRICRGKGVPRWLSDTEFTCQAEDARLLPGSERSPGEGNGNPLQYSCLGYPGGVQSTGSQRVEHNLATEHKLECHSRSPGKSLSIFIHHINVNRLEIGSWPARGKLITRDGNWACSIENPAWWGITRRVLEKSSHNTVWPTPVSLPGKSYGRRSLEGYSPWGRKKKSQMT